MHALPPLLACASLLAPARAQDVAAERFVLDNGLTVILHEDHTLPQVAVNLRYQVGSKDEPAGRSGFAHLFEHLMFRGTPLVPDGDFDRMMEAGGGNNNASTEPDSTTYYGEGPAELLPLLLWLEADRMRGLAITQEVLDTEREVVFNERRQGYEDQPYGRAELALSGLVYPAGHPYHIPVIGLQEDLEAATLDDVADFFAEFYVPSNACLVVAGDIDPEATRALVRQQFGSLPRGSEPARATAAPLRLAGRAVHTVADRVPYGRSTFLWHSPALFAEGDAELALVARHLADGLASRLHQALVVREGLAHEVSAVQQSQALGSLFRIDALAREGVALERLEAALERELAAFIDEGLSAEELARVQTGVEASMLRSMQSLQQRADRLGFYSACWGEPNAYRADLDRYRTATAEGCLAHARAVLGGGSVVLRVSPEDGLAAADPQPEPPAGPPAIGPPAALSVERPERFALSNGVAVELWSRPELPLVELSLLLPAGSAQDPAGREGVAHLTAAMLDEGAGERDARAFRVALEALGARFSSEVEHESTVLRLGALAQHLEASLALWADALQRPRFLDEEWERVRTEELAERALEREDPWQVAATAGAALYFGPEHAYGRPPRGTPESLARLDKNDLVRFCSDTYRPGSARLFVAGAVDRARLESALEASLGGWRGLLSPSGHHPRAPIGPPQGSPPRFAIVDRPGSAQTTVRVTLAAAAHDAPGRLEQELLAIVLGGTFTSRLNQNLRAERGITYGVQAARVERPSAATTVIQTSVQAAHTATAVREIAAELARLAAGGVGEEELTKARSTLRLGAIQACAGLAGVVSTATQCALLDRGVESVGEDLTRAAEIDRAALDAAAAGFASPGRVSWVLVGDGPRIEAALAELGLAERAWFDADGRPLEAPPAPGD